jgi:quinol monooxygenase YgiN
MAARTLRNRAQDDRIVMIEQYPNKGDAIMASGQRIVQKAAAMATRALDQRLTCRTGHRARSATGGRSNSDRRNPG